MANSYLALQPSEGILVNAAAQIYAAYLISGRAVEGTEDEWLERSIREAIRIAKTVDTAVQADKEVS